MDQKTISLPSAVSLVIASMVGVGVFTSVGFQLEGLPSAFPILLLWVVGGIVSLCGALCYAELVAMMPRSGGEYHLLRESYHPLAGFLAGWISMTAGFAAPIAALAMAFGSYAIKLGVPLSPGLIAVVLVLVVAFVHLGPLRLIGGFLTATTALKVALILAFVCGAVFLPHRPGQSLVPREGDLNLIASSDFAVAMVYVMFAYSGWNGAAYVAGEVRNPQRIVPLALTLGVVLVTLLYVSLNAVFLWRAPWGLMKGQVEAGLIAAEATFGPGFGRVMGALIAIGIVSTVASYTWAGSRVNERIGQDFSGLRALAGVNRWGAPHAALALQTALALGMLITGRFDAVVNYLMCLLQFCSLLSVAAVMVMRWRAPEAHRPFRVPFYPVTPLVFIAATAWVLVFQVRARPVESAWGLLTLAAGFGLYAWAVRNTRREGL